MKTPDDVVLSRTGGKWTISRGTRVANVLPGSGLEQVLNGLMVNLLSQQEARLSPLTVATDK